MSVTIIKDPLMEPYYVSKDDYCYTVYETITPQEKYLEEGSEGKEYIRPIGHYSSFASTLVKISEVKLNLNNKEYNSLKEYIGEWRKIKEEITQLIEF